MASSSRARDDNHKPPLKTALDPISSPAFPSLQGSLSIAKEVLMGFQGTDYRRSESVRILSDLAPTLMHSKYLNPSAGPSRQGLPPARPTSLMRLPTALPSGLSSLPFSSTANSLTIQEAVEKLMHMSLNETAEANLMPSLIRGFKATVPSSELPKQRRRMIRGGLVDEDLGYEKIGLKRLGDRARGLLTEGEDADHEGLGVGRKNRKKRRERKDMRRLEGKLHLEDLVKQADEIAQDKENLNIRTSLIHAEIYEVSAKIDALEDIRRRLETSLLRLQEEQLELDDELEGVQELMTSPSVTSAAGTKALPSSLMVESSHKSSRRRKGPAFLPSEHDELPSGVAFMSMSGHSQPITALDFTEPYGMLVTAGQDETIKVWDLCDGEQIGQLRGHNGTVRALQVEDTLCLTGGSDGDVRLWDMRIVEDYEDRLQKVNQRDADRNVLEKIADNRSVSENSDDWDEGPSGYTDASMLTTASQVEDSGPCVRVLGGHSKAISALSYEDGTLVTGSSDKTLRQWDVSTGQCVLVMDILWAISNPPTSPPSRPKAPRLAHRSSTTFGRMAYDDILSSSSTTTLSQMSGAALLAAATGPNFAMPTPPYSDGSWEMYQDFVGGLQFWGYALASGSGDGGVRMWDMRTGQAHRTLTGHTAPVTCLQFDENTIITGGLDKTIRIWDIRTGSIAETHRYEFPVTALQFDSRKIIACTGENGIEVYNRTTHAHSRLVVNGHIRPAEKLRFVDKYLVTGGRDGAAKVWAM